MFNIKCKNSINNVNSNNNVKGNITQTVNSIDMELLKKDLETIKEKFISKNSKVDLILKKLKNKQERGVK